jgi:hypothetical protein
LKVMVSMRFVSAAVVLVALLASVVHA